MQDKFEELAEDVDSKAAKVDCSKNDYIEGLQTIIDRLKMSKEAAEDF